MKQLFNSFLFFSLGFFLIGDLSPDFKFDSIGEVEARGGGGGGGHGGSGGGHGGGGGGHGGGQNSSAEGQSGTSNNGSRGALGGSSRGALGGSSRGALGGSSRGALGGSSRGALGGRKAGTIRGRPATVIGSRSTVAKGGRSSTVIVSRPAGVIGGGSHRPAGEDNNKSGGISLKRVSSKEIKKLIDRHSSQKQPINDAYMDTKDKLSLLSKPMHVAIAYLEQEKFEQAAPLLEMLSNDNNTLAQLLYAQLNFTGRGHPQHFEKAFFWALSSFLGGERAAAPLAVNLRKFISEEAQRRITDHLRIILSERAFTGDILAVSQLATWYYALAEPAELDGAYSWYAVAVALGDKGSENQRDTFLRELSPSQVKSAQLNAGKIFNKIKDNRR